MDFKYIEQLLDKYYRCETSLEEEDILKAFFSQSVVPQHLEKHKPLFCLMEREAANKPLDASFDKKVEETICGKQPQVKALRISMKDRMMPLLKAVASVAVVVALGNAAQLLFRENQADDDLNYSEYTDTYSDPAVAYDKVEGALQLISQGISRAAADSISLTARQIVPTDSICLE